MLAPKTLTIRRGSTILVVLGALAVMMIIAAAFMSMMEMDQMGALNSSDLTLARSVADGVTRSIVAQINGQAEGAETDLTTDFVAAGSLFKEGAATYPAAAVNLNDLFYGSAGNYEGYSFDITDLGAKTGSSGNPLQATVTVWVTPHDGLSVNDHGNSFGGVGSHSVIQGADSREVDLARAAESLMGIPSGDTSAETAVTAIVNNHRSPAHSGENGLFAHSLTDTDPRDGLLDRASGSSALRWTPLTVDSGTTRFGMESELVLQIRRSQAYATNSSDPIRTNVLAHFAAPLTGADIDATKQNWRKFTSHLTTLSRTRSAGVWRPDATNRTPVTRANLNKLGEGDNMDNLRAACTALTSSGWQQLMANLWAYTANHTAGVGYACPIDTSGVTGVVGNTAPPHRMPVVAGFHWRYKNVDNTGGAPAFQYGFAVMLVNPFDRPLDLSNMQLVLGTAPNTITASLATAISANAAASGTKVLVFEPDNSADPDKDPLFDTTTAGVDFTRVETGAAADGLDVVTLNAAQQAALQALLAITDPITGQRDVPRIELRYKTGLGAGKAGFSGRMIDFEVGGQDVNNSMGNTDARYRRTYPLDATTMAQVFLATQTIDAVTLNGWQSNTGYPRLYLGGDGALYHSVAEVGLLLNGGMDNTHRWFDPDNSGRLDEGDKFSLASFVYDSGGKYVDFFDLVKVADDPVVSTLETGQININTQPVGVLMGIPFFDRSVDVGGATKTVAEWVVEERNDSGPYRSRGDLVRRLPEIFGDQYAAAAWVRNTDSTRFDTYTDANDIHAKQFPFSVAARSITTRTDMFTVRVQVLVTVGSGTDKYELTNAVLTTIVDRSTGTTRILNQFWGVPVQR